MIHVNIRWKWLLLVIAAFHQSLFSAEHFRPDFIHPLFQSWQWQEVESLSPYGVQCLAENEAGIWFGTQKGLGLYDGRNVSFYTQEQGLSSNEVSNIVIGRKHNEVYAITSKGICLFQESSWTQISDIGYTIQGSKSAQESEDGTLWISNHNGLIRLKNGTAKLIAFQSKGVSQLLIDRSNHLWLSLLNNSEGDLLECPLIDGNLAPREQWKRHKLSPDIEREHIYLKENDDGQILAVSDRPKDQIHLYDPVKEQWSSLVPDFQLPGGSYTDILPMVEQNFAVIKPENLLIYENEKWSILSTPDYPVPGEAPKMFKTRNGEIWFYGEGERVMRVAVQSERWKTLSNLNFIGESEHKNQWFLHHDGSVVKHNSQKGIWTAYDQSDGLLETPIDGMVSKDGVVWISGSHHGTAAVSRWQKNQWITNQHEQFAPAAQHQSLFETSDGRIWITAAGNPSYCSPNFCGGILEYFWAKGNYDFRIIQNENMPYRISGIAEINDDDFWFSGRNTLQFDRSTAQTSNEITDERLINGWSDSLQATTDGSVWVIKWGLGLLRYFEGQWTLYNQNNAPFGNYVSHIMSDSNNRLWASTPTGIFIFDGKSWTTRLFDDAIRIFRNSGYLIRDKANHLWLNTRYYEWYLRTDEEHQNRYIARPEFYCVRYTPESATPDTEVLTYSKIIAPGSSGFFSWSGSDFMDATPQNTLQYSWKLDDGDWSPFSSKTNTYFSKLRRGNHQLLIRSRDADLNIDLTPASIDFQVMPPWWMNPWYAASILLLVIAAILFPASIIRLKIRHISEIESLKSDFFKNLSHHLRAPLSLSSTVIEKLKNGSLSQDQSQQINLIEKNTKSALLMVDELLDLKSIENDKSTQFQLTNGNIGTLVSDLFDQENKRNNHLNFDFQTSEQTPLPTYWFSQQTISKVVVQVIEFSCDRSPKNATIRCKLQQLGSNEKPSIKLAFFDEGGNMSRKDLSLIFEPYATLAQHVQTPSGKIGIGLHLSQSLVESVGGKITVENAKAGLRIAIEIPIYFTKPQAVMRTPYNGTEQTKNSLSIIEDTGLNSQALILILIKNKDSRLVMADELRNDFRVLTSEDGENGLKQAQLRTPDLIIMDLPPSFNGIEWTKTFKNTQGVNHIPMIILSDDKSMEVEHSYLEAGADEYVVKPILQELLLTRIHNLLMLQQTQKKRFKLQSEADFLEAHGINVNDEFLPTITDTILKNLSNEQFDIDELAKSLGMSRSTLYRKFATISTESPANYLKAIRMREATRLLERTQLSISEIMTRVGILDASHFSRSFKKIYNCPPTRYRTLKENEQKIAS